MAADSKSYETGKWVGGFFADRATADGRDPDAAKESAQRVARFFVDADLMSFGRLRTIAREMRESGAEQDGFQVSVTPVDQIPEVVDARAGVNAAFEAQFGVTPGSETE